MAALRVNCSLALTHQGRARGWKGRKYSFSGIRLMTLARIEHILANVVARAQKAISI